MPFEPQFKPGEIVTGRMLIDRFQCSHQGGMRRSLKTGSLVLTSDPSQLYQDRWEGSVLHYTGMGLRGDQNLDYSQNRTLAESKTNGVAVFLFENVKKSTYLYQGEVTLAGEPYQEKQDDEDGELRTVWMFPIEILDGRTPEPFPANAHDSAGQKRKKKARKISDEELERRLRGRTGKRGKRGVLTTSYYRDQSVAEFAKRRAKGRCDLCEAEAPFLSKDGEPYLESHHIHWLAKGGEDEITNTVALCPNCHRKMHVQNLTGDMEKLRKKASRSITG